MRSLETFTVNLKYRQRTGADVTTHPAFRNAAHTVAAIYDMKADSADREIMSFTDGGEQCSRYYLRARTHEDLRRRMRAHRMVADILNKLRKKC
jgi:aromatic ring hydroxylase